MLHSTYNGYQVHLIQDISEFEFIKQNLNEKVNVGCDSETTGLDYIKDEVVGVCIACGNGYDKNNYHGFYIPIRHLNYKDNLPVKETIELVQFIVDNYKTVWWNRNYDATMLEKDGFVMPFIGKTHDAQCMAHLVMGESFPALKDFANRLLKFDVIEFSENNAKDHNFGSTDPTITFKYAAQDPLVTTLTARKIWTDYPYIHKIYPIDNKFAESIRRLSMDAPIYLDRELLEKLYNENAAELAKVKQEIFSTVGYQFKLNSNRDKADVLSRYVTLTQKTAKGAFAVSDEVLASIDHPVARLLQKYAELEKLRGTYLEKMRGFAQPFYVNYQHCNVSTGRMSSGTSKGNSYFAPINIQNIPKVEIYKYLHKGGVLGYYLDYNKENAIAKMKCKGGMRDLFVAPEGYVWISGDYCLDPESIVITPQGNIKLKDLVEGQLVFTPEGYKRCYNVRKTGKHKIVKIKLKTGEVLKCSAEHRILIKRNGLIMWKKAGELISTDYIFSINNIKYLENHGINIRDVEEDSGR